MNGPQDLRMVGLPEERTVIHDPVEGGITHADHHRIIRGIVVGVNLQSLHIANCRRKSDGSIIPVLLVCMMNGENEIVMHPLAITLTPTQIDDIEAPTEEDNPPLEPPSQPPPPPGKQGPGLILPGSYRRDPR